MLKNPNYIYGPSSADIPLDINLGNVLLKEAYKSRNKIALINADSGEVLTYNEILNNSMKVAMSLTRQGIKKGDVIGICSDKRPEFWPTVLGIIYTGAIFTPINPGYVKDELLHVVNIVKPKIVFISPEAYKTKGKLFASLSYVKKIVIFGDSNVKSTGKDINHQDLIKDVNVRYEDFSVQDVMGQIDTCFILFSSGTTGLPKGVMLSHLNVLAFCSQPMSVPPGEIPLTVAPWFHAYGLMKSIVAFSFGRTTVFLPKFDMEKYLNAIQKYKVTHLLVVPPIAVALAKHQSQHDLSSVIEISSGAAPLREDTIEAVMKRFPNLKYVLQGYGMTEATLGILHDFDKVKAKPGSVGTVAPGFVVKVVDINTRTALGPKKEGEICFKGPQTMQGYIGKDKKEDFEDNFFKTGDIGYYDEDGHFFIVDRLKELIKYKGYQVPPAEIEAVLLQHEAVRDAGVIGIEDSSAGELPLAFVALQPGKQVTEKEIKAFVAEKLSNPKHLRGGVRFVQEIPKNPTGKILRKELKKMAAKKLSKL